MARANLHRIGVLDALATWPKSHRLRTSGLVHVSNGINKHDPGLAERATKKIFATPDAQTRVLPKSVCL